MMLENKHKKLNLIFFAQQIPWFGKHTGYEQLPKFIQQFNNSVRIISVQKNLANRIAGKAYCIYRQWNNRNSYHVAAELKLAFMRFTQTNSVSHILYLEDSLPFFDCWEKAPNNLTGTIHLPPSQWNETMLQNLRRLSHAMILYQRDLEFFETYVGKGKVYFIPYGVDTQFFVPSPTSSDTPKRILFAGHYLRNTVMLSRIILSITEKYPEIKFDLLVPESFRNKEGFNELLNHPSVTWHKNLSDEELRNLYQKSYLLLLPMNESGANTAVVESLACGLPIVTTDVGGIRDYGGNDVFPIVSNNDDQGMIDLIEKYLHNLDWRNQVAHNCRLFAEKNLAWPIIAQKHLEIYNKL